MTTEGQAHMVPAPPVPDPTVITTEIINKEIRHLRELVESQIKNTDTICAQKFMSVEQKLLQLEQQRIELKTDTKETRVEQKRDTKDAVDAAFAAAKEAVEKQTTASGLAIAKSEAQTTTALAQLSANFTTSIAGLTEKVGDLSDRVRTIESLKQGSKETQAGFYALLGLVVAVAALAVAGLVAAWPR